MTSATPPAVAEIVFLDVGQGDSTLLVDLQTGEAMLIDCPSAHADHVSSILTAGGWLLKSVLVTHWDRDHYGGIARIAGRHSPAAIHYNHDTLLASARGAKGIKSTLKAFLALPHQSLHGATVQDSGVVGRIDWKILAPTHSEVTAAVTSENRNVASCVVDVNINSTRLLIGGDAVSDTWERLVAQNVGTADLLRWPHHGADLHGDPTGAVAARVISHVSPKYVVISVGNGNGYGHPSTQVVGLAARSCQMACTQKTTKCTSTNLGAHSLCGTSLKLAVNGSGCTLEPWP